MKGIVFLGDRKAAIKQFADPEPGIGEVVVRMKASGICGSDLHVYRREPEHFQGRDERIPGHEPSGVVASIGSGIRNLKPGDRVCINHYLGCGHCRHCADGYFQWCPDAQGYGGPIHGSHADLVLADARNCVPLPESVSFADGAFVACAGGTAYSAMRKLNVSGRTTVAVFGLGPVGLSGVLLAKAMGSTVIGIDVVEERVALAKQIGADLVIQARQEDVPQAIRRALGGGCDAAFEASGSTEGRLHAVKCLRRGGKAAFVGFGSNEPVINPSEIIGSELTLMGSFVLALGGSYELVDFLVSHRLSFDPIVTHEFSIEDGVEAYRVADTSRTGKVMLMWE